MTQEKMKTVLSLLTVSILVITIGWGGYWLFIAAYNCAPNAEDLALAYGARQHGQWTLLTDILISNYTRYTAGLLYGFNVLVFNGVEYFAVMPITCFIFFTASFYYFITSVIKSQNIKWFLVCYSLFFVIFHYALEPSLPYGLTYMVSTFVYIYPWFFTFLWIGSFLRTIRETNNTKRYLLSLVGYLSLVLSFGSTELFISLNSIFLFGFFISILLNDRTKLMYIIPYVIVGVSSIAFIFLCPSPKVQSGTILYDYNERYPGSNFVIESLKSYLIFYKRYLLQPLSLCFVLITTFLFRRFEIIKRLNFNFTNLSLGIIFVVSVIGAYITTWVFFIPKGKNDDFSKYIYNTVSVLSQIGLFVIIPIYLSKLLSSLHRNRLFPLMEVSLSALLFMVLIFSSNNISTIKREYGLGYIQDVRNKFDKFYSSVTEAKGSGVKNSVVFFEDPKVIPASIFLDYDILPNRAAACWNLAYEDYFGVGEVRMKGDTIFK